MAETSRMNWIYEVFLSFRGEDTRAPFTSRLCASLQNAGITVFRDDDSLERGDHISASLLRGIEKSQISIVVFSKNYADSRWCLEELVKIMECRRTIGQVVLPVFYDVDPSEVFNQIGEFGIAFQNLLNRISKEEDQLLKSWRTALREAGDLVGFVVLNSRNGSEAIKDIVENVTHLLDKTNLFIANYPVGVESRVQDMIQLLDTQQSNDVRLLGICGMGGIGKTTIAKAVYNKIGQNFEGRSFLANIREVWEQKAGQEYLQEHLLSDIFKEKITKIQSIESGNIVLRDKLNHKRVLLVLDDVDKLDQLNALCGSREWFGLGSRIIITTRDKYILRGSGVDCIYTMGEMNESDSTELFSWHAFKKASPREDFAEISKELVEYSGGLPLALEILGSHLFDRRVTEWKSILEKLKRIPNDQVQKKLKISYDGLNDDTEKEIFLDIACFFIGMDLNDVTHILNGCGFFAEIGISVLVERNLVTIDDKNKLGMHGLLRDMGREIIREKSPMEPEKCSRLCFHEDVLDVLLKQTGTKAVEGLALKLPRSNSKCISTKAFKSMKRLRLLQLAGVQLDGDFEYLSKNLRWLCWNGFPLTYIPTNFYQGNLVSIELEYSNLKLVWKETQMMEKLKILNLSHSHYLKQTPDFSRLPNLEKLILTDCPRLSEISPSIGYLNKVLLINLEDCIHLRNLPRSIYKLKYLKTLILSGCLMIDKLEDDLEQMESLTTLIADNTAITRVPFSLVRSKSIGYISLCGYRGFSCDVFPSIIWSWMSPTNNPSSLFQTSGSMSSLVPLNVRNSSTYEVSSISKYLPKLRSLWVECGSELQLSQDAARILDVLYATNSKELESIATTSHVSNMKTYALIECCSQVHISGSKNSLNSLIIQVGMNCKITNILKESILQNMNVCGSGGCLLPGDSYPNWLTFDCEGSSVVFEVPQVEGLYLKAMMCIVYSSAPNNITLDGLRNVLVINHTKSTIQLYNREALASFENEEWQRVVSSIEPGNRMEVVVVLGNNFTVKKTTIYLIYDEPNGEKMEQCHAPDKNVIVCSDDKNEWISSQVLNSRNESEDVTKVVENVTNLQDNTDLLVGDCLMGVESLVDVIQLLNNQKSKDTLIIGIWGMGGIGKTTIAKAVYNKFGLHFEAKSFLQDVRGVWKQDADKISLQQQLLFDICKTKKIKIDTVELGKLILQERLHGKRILLVLDNVNKLDQLNALCGNRKWFGQGSRIIITTRNKQIFSQLEVDQIYRMKEMDQNESLELFSWHAFKQPSPRKGFTDLSSDVVKYCGGLPLALKVIGTFLVDKSKAEWKNAMERLKIIPHDIIMENLRISFDDLSDNEKEIFLYIASFFVGMDQNDIIQILEHSRHFIETGIHVLVEQSLVIVDSDKRIGMHNLIRGMGREITRQKSMDMAEARIYDVFLSFRGEDTRASFVSHLYTYLQNAGIHVFRDNDEIQRGNKISVSLLKAVKQCRISIVVLSINYANSRWCMLELERIMEIHRTRGLVVVPVFYGVGPSEVRHQLGMFGEAFEDLISRNSVDEFIKNDWKMALLEVGSISGFVVMNSRDESADITNIVEHVTRLLDRRKLFVTKHPVGVESRVQTAIEQLNIQQSEAVLLLGIWGMGGSGKTTIAKAIYNEIGDNFEGRCFLLNIREVWEQQTYQVTLQQQLLGDICKTMKKKIDNIESGKITLEERLTQKRILLVLDDVNNKDQLNALCGNRKWFGLGSRIIITTRDKSLLTWCRVDHVYKIEEMNENESLELFSMHAFNKASPKDDFARHSRDVVAYSGGLPLAHEVLGSYLFDRGITEWVNVLEKLKRIPNNQIYKKLKVSFDGLSDPRMKEIFLDVACFFIGMDRNDVTKILDGCGFHARAHINDLVERSLLTVDSDNKLRMHDLLRDMGREIVCAGLPFEPEKHSRLWHHEEVLDVLSNPKGAKAVQGLVLKLPPKNTFCLNAKAFENMNKLRLLQLVRVQHDGDFKYLPKGLRWLCWHEFPSTIAPAEFQQGSLVAIYLKYSKLERLWKKGQMLEKLKILNLSHSLDLTETPDFSYLPNLEKLVLKDCPSLPKVSHTIGSLHKILLINLKGCTSLQKLPRCIYKLKSLKALILSGCSKIDKLEEDIEQMESLTTLIAAKTAITKVPFSIVRLKNIGYISLCGFEGFSRDVFPSLIWSLISPRNNVISQVQASLVPLDFSYWSSYSQSSTFKDLPKLYVECGSELQLTQDIQRIVDALKAINCQKLEATTSQISDMYTSPSIDCCSQVCMSRLKNYLKSFLIQMGTKCRVPNITKDSILQTTDGTGDSFLLPWDNNSNWLTFSCKGCSVVFEVPKMKGHNMKRMTFIAYSSSWNNTTSQGLQNLWIINHTKATFKVYKIDTLTSFEDEERQSITSNLEPGNKVEVMVVFREGLIIEKTSVYLLYDESIDKEMEHCHEVGKGVIVSSDDDNSVSVFGGDDMAANKNFAVSGGDDMPTDKKVIVSGGDENRFRRLFTLPSLVRAVLISRHFWFGLVGILVWITWRRFKKQRSRNLVTRYTMRKWLVNCALKLINYLEEGQ